MSTASVWIRTLLLAATLAAGGVVQGAGPLPVGKVTLNFVNSDISTVIKAMSDMTGRTFVVDPRVKGTLNITSPRPVSASVAYDILLSSLRMQGFAAVQVDGVVRIIPEADAKFYAVPMVARPARSRVGGEMATRVFTLKHESSAQFLAALRPLVGPNGVMSAEPSSNTLVVTDYADNLARLAQVIESMDVPSADDPVLIPLRYASAEEVAALVGRVFTQTAGAGAIGAGLGPVQVSADTRSNSLIVRGRDRNMVNKVQKLADTLDVPTPAAGNVHVIYMKNASAVEVAKTLRNILSGDTSALQQVQGQSVATTALPGTPGVGTATLGAQQAAGLPSGAGMIQADAASNALIITAPEAIFNNIKVVAEKLDVRRAQVLIEALITEVTADKAAQFGIQWMGATTANSLSQGTNIGGLFGNSDASTNIASIAGAINSGGSALASIATNGLNLGLYKTDSLGVLARALQTDADANVLSTPTLLTLDNEEAKISVGSNVPFATGSYTNTGASSTSVNPFTTYERKDVGLTLRVKPQISEGGTVRLEIYQEVSKLNPAADPTLSTTDKRSIESTVLVDDGRVIVLGGLIEDQVADSQDRVPILGDIPVLGHLFRYTKREHKKINLMVFLRPVIVRDTTTATAVTNPRYDYILGQQTAATPRQHPILPDMKAPTMREDVPTGAAASLSPSIAAAMAKEPGAVQLQGSQQLNAGSAGTTVPAQNQFSILPEPEPESDPWWSPRR